jgi:uncharacterized repeat protein (TIGR01451 family)
VLLVVVSGLAFWSTTLTQAQTCGVPGQSGQASITAPVNTYFAGSGTVAAGATSLTLATGTNATRGVATSLLAGDLVLIIQMQDNSGGLEGNYEYAVVAVGGGAGATIQFTRPLVNAYAQSIVAAAGTVRTYQVVRVPQYSAATLSGTINVLPWFVEPTNGFGTGGIFAIDVAGQLTLNGATINAAGRGFRGGAGINSTQNRAGGTFSDGSYTTTVAALNGGLKGEGTEGIPIQVLGFNSAGTAGTITSYVAAGALFNATNRGGYVNGPAGRAAVGNAGGGGNDGLPASGANGQNSGGGGGSHAGAGGQGGNSWNNDTPGDATLNNPTTVANSGLGGNPAGGAGGNALSPSVATRLFFGGGGGSGGANNGTANAITTFPPTAATGANGASGAVTSSGAPGGGMVLLRAGSASVSAASTVTAAGLQSYNKNPTTNTDSAGGGGAGGTVVVDILDGVSSLANLVINAAGGNGGSSNYFNHGPGGGGGGGYVYTRTSGAAINTANGTNGLDGCCGGTAGNLSPKAYNATPGSAGSNATGALQPPGAPAGSQCLPNLTVTKRAITPTITASTGATAQFVINASNSGGAATNVFLYDPGLPPGWTFLATPAPTYAYSPAPPFAANAFAAGAETTAATGPTATPVLPVNSYTTVNSVTAVSLRAAAAAPGLVPSVGQGSLTFGSFFLPQGGSVSVTFVVSIPNTASVGTYHNAAGATYLDPTRTSNTARAVAMASAINSNRLSLSYSGNTSFQSGGTTTVPGSHFNGLQAGPASDDVQLLPDLSITKAAAATVVPGGTIQYTLTPRNNGRAIGALAFSTSQATDVLLANVGTSLAASPLTLTDTLPSGVFITTTFVGGAWACSGTGSGPVVCSLPDVNAWPIAAATNFQQVTTTALVTCAGGNGKTNTAVISTAAGETLTGNNTGTITTNITPACVNANLTVAKTNGVTTVPGGSTTTYTVTFANLGPGAANNAVVFDSPGAGLTCTNLVCGPVGGGALCPTPNLANFLNPAVGLTLATFPANSTVTFRLTCNVTAVGP